MFQNSLPEPIKSKGCLFLTCIELFFRVNAFDTRPTEGVIWKLFKIALSQGAVTDDCTVYRGKLFNVFQQHFGGRVPIVVSYKDRQFGIAKYELNSKLHFVLYDTNKMIYDPIEDGSQTVKNGTIQDVVWYA